MCTPDFGTCSDGFALSAATQRWTQIGMTNDGEPFVLGDTRPTPGGAVGIMRYSLQSATMRGVNPPVTYEGLLAVSDDGVNVIIGNHGTASGAVQPMQLFRLTGTTFNPTPMTQTVEQLAIDGRGAHVIVNATMVFDPGTFTQQASLPATSQCAVMSRDGTRAYTFDSGVIRTFDLSTPKFSGQYPEIGSGATLAGDPGAGTNCQDMRMVLSPDGKTLFLAGSLGLVVQPVP
jgi:hypothetical protein